MKYKVRHTCTQIYHFEADTQNTESGTHVHMWIYHFKAEPGTHVHLSF